MSNERIDLTQFETMIETANGYMGRWFKGTVLPSGDKWRSIKDLGLHVDWSHNEVFGPLVEEFPALIAELKRCYDFIESHGLDEDIEHKMVIDLRECSWECLHQLCVQAGVEDGTKEEMIARLLE